MENAMTPQTPTFTAQQFRERANDYRDDRWVHHDDRTANMLDFAADRLAHEEQTTAILGPIDETPCDTAERLRAEGRAEVYAEIAKLRDWLEGEKSAATRTINMKSAPVEAVHAALGLHAAYRATLAKLDTLLPVGPAAPDGVD